MNRNRLGEETVAIVNGGMVWIESWIDKILCLDRYHGWETGRNLGWMPWYFSYESEYVGGTINQIEEEMNRRCNLFFNILRLKCLWPSGWKYTTGRWTFKEVEVINT